MIYRTQSITVSGRASLRVLYTLLVLGICFILSGAIQLLLPKPNVYVHTPGSISAAEMIKSIPLYGHPECILDITGTGQPQGDHPLLSENYALDTARISFIMREDPEGILSEYDSWFVSTGWQTRGTFLGGTFPRDVEKGSSRTTGYNVACCNGWPLSLPYMSKKTEFTADYRLTVRYWTDPRWPAGDKHTAESFYDIPIIVIVLSRQK